MLACVGPAPPELTVLSSVNWPLDRLTANALIEPDPPPSTLSVAFVDYIRVPAALKTTQLGLVPSS